jgi:hypothetical protein
LDYYKYTGKQLTVEYLNILVSYFKKQWYCDYNQKTIRTITLIVLQIKYEINCENRFLGRLPGYAQCKHPIDFVDLLIGSVIIDL